MTVGVSRIILAWGSSKKKKQARNWTKIRAFRDNGKTGRIHRTRAEHPVRCVVRCVATSSKRTLQGEHQTWETLKTPCGLAVFNPSCALRCQTLHNSRQIFPKNWALSAKQQCNPRIGGATGESKQVAKWQRRCSVTRWVDTHTHTHQLSGTFSFLSMCSITGFPHINTSSVLMLQQQRSLPLGASQYRCQGGPNTH